MMGFFWYNKSLFILLIIYRHQPRLHLSWELTFLTPLETVPILGLGPSLALPCSTFWSSSLVLLFSLREISTLTGGKNKKKKKTGNFFLWCVSCRAFFLGSPPPPPSIVFCFVLFFFFFELC